MPVSALAHLDTSGHDFVARSAKNIDEGTVFAVLVVQTDILTETCGVAPTAHGCGHKETQVAMEGV